MYMCYFHQYFNDLFLKKILLKMRFGARGSYLKQLTISPFQVFSPYKMSTPVA